MRGEVFQGHLASPALSGVVSHINYKRTLDRIEQEKCHPERIYFMADPFGSLYHKMNTQQGYRMCPEEEADYSFEEINQWNKRTKPEYKTTLRVKKMFLYYQKGCYPIQPRFQCKTLHQFGVATQPVTPDGCIELGWDDETTMYAKSLKVNPIEQEGIMDGAGAK